MKKNKFISFKSRGFTDKLYFINFCFTWAFMAVCIILTAVGQYTGTTNMDLLAYGIPAAFGELAIHTGFIIHKAKVENLEKHKLDRGQIIDIE